VATLCYRNTLQNSVEKVAYTTCSLDYTKRGGSMLLSASEQGNVVSINGKTD